MAIYLNPVFELVNLKKTMQVTEGKSAVSIAMIDGPVNISNPYFNTNNIKFLNSDSHCSIDSSFSCSHGTFIAGMFKARRDSPAPGLCPEATLKIYSIFEESNGDNKGLMKVSEMQLYNAIINCINARANVINLSLSQDLINSSLNRSLITEAIDLAAKSNILVFAAAGNNSIIGNSVITKHPWVICVAACDNSGKALELTNLGLTTSLNGLIAPGYRIKSLSPVKDFNDYSGTSAAVAFASGAAVLLWSEFTKSEAAHIRYALIKNSSKPKKSIIPGLLNVDKTFEYLSGKLI